MAAPDYSTDLTDFEDFEAASTISTELVGYTATAKGEDQDADYPIQGSQHATAEQRTAAKGSLASDYGSNISWTSGWYFFLWGIFLAPAAVNSDTNAGIEMSVGSDISNFWRWTVGGNDFGRYPYGGWQNFVVNPEISEGRSETGTGSANYRWVGMCCDVISAIAKGSPYGIDVIRYGRGSLTVSGGEAADYGTFDGMATQNDNNSNRWGLFSEQAGSYLWKGLMSLGVEGASQNAVDFRDSNRNIVVDNTRRVLSDFNKIEINQASSRVDWTNINITALGTVSKGEFEIVDNADVNFEGCVFTDMGEFTFLSNSTIDSTTFRRCEQVDWGGAAFDGCLFENTSASAALYCEDLEDIDNCTFSGGDEGNNAIHMPVSGSYTFVGNTFTGYGASGSPSASIYHDSGGHLTINVQGGDSPTVYNVGASTAEVNNPIILTISNLVSGSEVRIYSAGTITELSGVEDSALSHQYPYTYASETYVDIVVHHVDYVYIRLDSYLLLDTSTSIPIQQQSDRWYSNP